MVKLGMMSRAVNLLGPAPVSPYEPTQEFVETFLEVRKQMLEKAKNGDERVSATSYSVAIAVKLFLDEAELNLDPAVRLARLINYHFVMSMYMSGSGVCDKYGIDGWEYLPPVARKRREERLAREKRRS